MFPAAESTQESMPISLEATTITSSDSLIDQEIARIELFEEVPQIQTRAIVREVIQIRKVVHHDGVDDPASTLPQEKTDE